VRRIKNDMLFLGNTLFTRVRVLAAAFVEEETMLVASPSNYGEFGEINESLLFRFALGQQERSSPIIGRIPGRTLAINRYSESWLH